MREEYGDLWEFYTDPLSIACITTNGFVKANGECVMGRGVARDARDKFPGIARQLGDLIRREGNRVHGPLATRVISFPTKHVWWDKSDLALIAESAAQLAERARANTQLTYYLPRPGCSNGKLTYEEVRPVLIAADLPDNVVVIDRWEAK